MVDRIPHPEMRGRRHISVTTVYPPQDFPGSGLEGGGSSGRGGGVGGRSRVVRAWRRGVGVCLVMVAASFSFFLMSSPQRAELYARVVDLSQRSPEYVVDVLVPSLNTSVPISSPSSPSSASPPQEQGQKGFLVHTPGCIIPDFDPFHHTITRFISHPDRITCKGPPELTSARGTTLHFHHHLIHLHFSYFYLTYQEKIASLTTTTTTKALTTTTTTTSSTSPPSTTTSPPPPSKKPSKSPPEHLTSTPSAPHSSRAAGGVSEEYLDLGSATGQVGVEGKGRPEDVWCCYKAINRVEQDEKNANNAADGRWGYSDWCHNLTQDATEVREEAVLVECQLDQVIIYKNIHYFIQPWRVNRAALDTPPHPKDITVPRPNDATPTKGKERVAGAEKLSVIIFGTDSSSRLNMQRHLPKTYHYLTQELGALDLGGYNKVGDNTYPNLIPILGGLPSSEIDNHNCMSKKKHFDKCRWIWKDFKDNGYVTAFVEDAAWMGVFNYIHNGFRARPTDYYGRPFFLASEKEIGGSKQGNANVCQGSTLSMKVIHDYSLEVARTFLDVPTFGLYWSASLSHDYLNMLRHADEPHLRYLQELREMGALNHTALFFISDHGMRWGNIRSTYVGMLEERLPFALLYLPPWFREKYSKAYNNAITNTHRLTSNYDLYETMNDLAYGRFANPSHVASSPALGARGISLFKNIPRDRTCTDAGVPLHFCTCQDTTKVTSDDPIVGVAATFLMETLNGDLKPHQQCAQFSEVRVVTARVSRSNKELAPSDLSSDVKTYLLQAVLSPGNVTVEATLRYNPQPALFQVVGDVSRINKYGGTSGCIHHDLLRKFCYCKDQLKAEELHRQQQEQQGGLQQDGNQQYSTPQYTTTER